MLLSYKPLHLEAQQRLQQEGCVVDIKELRQAPLRRLGGSIRAPPQLRSPLHLNSGPTPARPGSPTPPASPSTPPPSSVRASFPQYSCSAIGNALRYEPARDPAVESCLIFSMAFSFVGFILPWLNC